MTSKKNQDSHTDLQSTQNEPKKGVTKFRTPFTYITKKTEQEIKSFLSPSQTVPDMTLSLQELVQRYTRGQSVATFTPVYYGEDEEFADVSRMDPMERIEYARFIRQKIGEHRTSLAEHTRAEGREPQTRDGQNSTEEQIEQNALS